VSHWPLAALFIRIPSLSDQGPILVTLITSLKVSFLNLSTLWGIASTYEFGETQVHSTCVFFVKHITAFFSLRTLNNTLGLELEAIFNNKNLH
jgi:hypothetical protein